MFLACLPERSIHSSDLLTQTLNIMSLRNRGSRSVWVCLWWALRFAYSWACVSSDRSPEGDLFPFERNVVLGDLLSPVRK